MSGCWSTCIPSKHKTFAEHLYDVGTTFDVGPTLYKCYADVLCLLDIIQVGPQPGMHIHIDQVLTQTV